VTIARTFVYLTVTCCFAFAGCFRGTGTAGPQYLPEATVVAIRSANSSYKVLHYFGKGSDGYAPLSSLIAVNTLLYGATFDGGSSNLGAVYSITPTGSEKVLHSFAGGSDGANPESDLVDVNGTLYGTTFAGGSSNAGTVYSITLNGKEKVLYSFAGGLDGANPESGLIDVNGTLYGTTLLGGNATTPECFPKGCGTVYTFTMRGAQKVLHIFAGGPDGAHPESGLIDVHGTLYGTTGGGGGVGCSLPPRETRASESIPIRGCGTVYSIGADGVENVLYRFDGGTDGLVPTSGLLNVKGTLYGTASVGGADGHCFLVGCGTIYAVSRKGVAKLLYDFGGGSDGEGPDAGLTSVNGLLYGTTEYGGGSSNAGTVYSITLAGTEKVLHRFRSGSSDGANPESGLVDVKGKLYGTTANGGRSGCLNGCGTVFVLTP
jgi:uncharacterized repeat protein (TIGR03803 family)